MQQIGREVVWWPSRRKTKGIWRWVAPALRSLVHTKQKTVVGLVETSGQRGGHDGRGGAATRR